MKGFALGLALKMRVFGTRKWPLVLFMSQYLVRGKILKPGG